MARPKPGDMQERYYRMFRVDLAKGPRGWWLTIWRATPPSQFNRWYAASERWYLAGRVRVILRCVVVA